MNASVWRVSFSCLVSVVDLGGYVSVGKFRIVTLFRTVGCVSCRKIIACPLYKMLLT